jgi:hypothetical protein
MTRFDAASKRDKDKVCVGGGAAPLGVGQSI